MHFCVTIPVGTNGTHVRVTKLRSPAVWAWADPSDPVAVAAVEWFRANHDNVRKGRAPEGSTSRTLCLGVEIDGQMHALETPSFTKNTTDANVGRKMEAIFNPKQKTPLEHQIDLIEYISANRDFTVKNPTAFLVYWEMGSGKTHAGALLTATGRSRHTVCLCHVTNIGQWVRAVAEVALNDGGYDRVDIDVMGFAAFSKWFSSPQKMRGVQAVVVDEAHVFRNNTPTMQSTVATIRQANHVFLLTGTPLVNSVDDIDGMLPLMFGSSAPRSRPPPLELQKMLEGNLSWFDPAFHRPAMHRKHYPTVTHAVVPVQMSWLQTLQYMQMRSSTFAFNGYQICSAIQNRYNCQTRAVCNAPLWPKEADSPKLRKIVDTVMTYAGIGPQVVHSSLIDSALAKLRDMLPKTLRMEMITGSTQAGERTSITKLYNAGKLDVLLISDASQFGADLHGTAVMHMSEPQNNVATEKQTAARAIRMFSHDRVARKTVLVLYYISTFPKTDMTKEDTEAMEKYADATDMFGIGKKGKAVKFDHDQIRGEMFMNVADEFGETINERQRRVNAEQQVAMDPYTEIGFRKASIQMTQQKSSAAIDAEAAQEGAKIVMRSVAVQTTMVKEPKESSEPKAANKPKESIEPKAAKKPKEPKETKETKETNETKETKETKDTKETETANLKETKTVNPKETKELKATKPKDPKAKKSVKRKKPDEPLARKKPRKEQRPQPTQSGPAAVWPLNV